MQKLIKIIQILSILRRGVFQLKNGYLGLVTPKDCADKAWSTDNVE
ncbi:hypothetical protein [Algoriphagus ratkowskyi]|nr:hypothetical protein [Algoriphagus ratkowskyi]